MKSRNVSTIQAEDGAHNSGGSLFFLFTHFVFLSARLSSSWMMLLKLQCCADTWMIAIQTIYSN